MRRPALLAALAGLHVAGALLMWRSVVVLPERPPTVYASLIFVPEPFVMPTAPKPFRTTPHTRREPTKLGRPALASQAGTPATLPADISPPAAPETTETAPTLDLAELRAAAGRHERQRVHSGLELAQEEQRVRGRDDSDAARAIKKAGRVDCTKAYAGGGFDPLKLVPLIYDTLTDTGCKW